MKNEYVFIPIYRSFGFRYLLSAGIIEELSKKYKLVFFINIHHKSFFEKYLRKYNPIFEDIMKYETKNNFSKFRNFINLLKKFFNGQNKYLKNNSFKVWKVKFKNEIKKKPLFFLIYPIAFFLNHSAFLRKIFFKLEQVMDNKIDFRECFNRYSPKLLLITSYGYDYDQYFAKIAKKNNCKTISIIYSWDNPTSKGYKSSNSDFYLVWNENMKQELITFHDIEMKKIKICGTAHWDTFYNDLKNKINIRKKFFHDNNLSSNKKIILFFSSSPKDFNNAYDKIDKICTELSSDSNYLLIARMHPLYMDENLCKMILGEGNRFYETKLLNKHKKNLKFFNPITLKFGSETNEVFYPLEDLEVLKKLYSSANVLLNEYSTTLLEGIIFDLPIINVAIGGYRNTNLPISFYNQHHHLWRLQKYNAIIECDNYKGIKNIIDEITQGKDPTKLNRQKLMGQEMNVNNGNASKKIIEEIKNIISY